MSIGISLGHFIYYSINDTQFFKELPKISHLDFIKTNTLLLIAIIAYKFYDENN
jgi:hypothetical protein